MNITRRDWMLAAACWTEVLRAQQQAPAKFVWFDPPTAAEIEAIAAQILPDDDTPGARAAGVIWFIDRALAGYDQDKQQLYRDGLTAAQAKRAELFPASTNIAALSAEQQVALLKAIEKTDFFLQVRTHTVLGFLGHPMHGGNRDMVGWKLIGVDHQMQYQPPFGYYDAEAARGSK
ncbi:MAG TPA: gluconate 2-dehydrogenase subunit 3 family protein [Bryobacteraceae bacterium]|nr:gluconate 2-dehydrogenase subunit 3 family protein [Bryobacteraceae bacterium]